MGHSDLAGSCRPSDLARYLNDGVRVRIDRGKPDHGKAYAKPRQIGMGELCSARAEIIDY